MAPVRTRVLTGFAYGAVFISAVSIGGGWLTLLVAALFIVGLWELVRLAGAQRDPRLRVPAFAAGALVLAGGLFAFLFLSSYVQGSSDLLMPDPPFWRQHWTYPWLWMALVPTWLADIAAYAVGSLAGRHKLAPRLSPGKTWEGSIGGFAAAALGVWLIGSQLFVPPLATATLLVLALAVGPVGLLGDLAESALKRGAGAKDSGALFPGHGGVLDRIDSLIFVAPAVSLVLALARQYHGE